MNDQGERIELLINRKLDGELTLDEDLELSRALIRMPEYRQMLECSECIDGICVEVLGDEIGEPSADVALEVDRVLSRLSRSKPRKRALRHRVMGRLPQAFWWSAPAAMAACLGWMAFIGPLDMGSQALVAVPVGSVPVDPGLVDPDRVPHEPVANVPVFMEQGAGGSGRASSGGSMRLTNGYLADGFSDDGRVWSDAPKSAYRRVRDKGAAIDLRRDTGYLGVLGDDGNMVLIEVNRTRAVGRPRPKYRLVAGDF